MNNTFHRELNDVSLYLSSIINHIALFYRTMNENKFFQEAKRIIYY